MKLIYSTSNNNLNIRDILAKCANNCVIFLLKIRISVGSRRKRSNRSTEYISYAFEKWHKATRMYVILRLYIVNHGSVKRQSKNDLWLLSYYGIRPSYLYIINFT